MTPLRQRMLQDMVIRDLAVNTQLAHVQQISAFARHFNCSPDTLGPEQVRAYKVHVIEERKLAAGSLSVVAAALRFLYKITLRRPWNDDDIPMPKRPLKLPIVLSPEEVVRFLACVASTKHRAILTTIYASGLRVSEAVALCPADIDSSRVVLRVDQGKSRKDRYVMLSPPLLEVLRDTGASSATGRGCSQGTVSALISPRTPSSRPARRRTAPPASTSPSRRTRFGMPSPPSGGGRHRRAPHQTSAGPSQPVHDLALSEDRNQQPVRHRQSLGSVARSAAQGSTHPQSDDASALLMPRRAPRRAGTGGDIPPGRS